MLTNGLTSFAPYPVEPQWQDAAQDATQDDAAGAHDDDELAGFRVAIVHEWFVNQGGSEKVVEQILQVFPQADLFALVDFLPEDQRGFIGNRKVTTTFIQRLPRARKSFRNYLLLMPLAIEQFDLSSYDLVISSSHAVAKGVITGPRQVHVSYVHSPMRYAWDLQHQYLRESRLLSGMKSWAARICLHLLRMWDSRTASGVDAFLANSAYIAKRIRKTYGRGAKVVYPPVDIGRFELRRCKEDYYVTVSRLVPYKQIPLIAEAFARMPERRLVIVGAGPDAERLKEIASRAPNILLLGYQPDEVVADYMASAKAFVFAAEEDFGIAVVEAQACGTPVVAFGAGGAYETVVESRDPTRRTGVFFGRQTARSICEAMDRFEAIGEFDARVCRANAERFSIEQFRKNLLVAVKSAVARCRLREHPRGV
jgi:glycosyltransferase involved in cell wall biosynthesis